MIWIYGGERAQVTGLPIGSEVRVKEVNARKIYTTTYESTDSNGNKNTSISDDGITVKIPPANSIEVKATNTFDAQYAKNLTVIKNFDVNGEISDPASSLAGGDYGNIEFILKEKTGDDKYTPVGTPVKFKDFTPNANGTSAQYEFKNLDSTKTYVVEENRANAELYGGTKDKPYSNTEYQIDEAGTNDTIKGDDSKRTSTLTADFGLTNDKTVTFTNVYAPSINVRFDKVDKDAHSKHLKGAKFKLTKKNGDSFTTVKDASGHDVVVSDDTVINLSTGEYQLTETEAPAGYNLLTGTVDFKIENRRVVGISTDTSVSSEMYTIKSDDKSNVVTIMNKAGVALPVTGGTGTILFSLGGMALMLIALGYVVMKRREEGVVIK